MNNNNTLNIKFTVIIPVKNRANYLDYTLKTCINQDYENLEIIVSDDCSDDNLKQVVDSAIKIDSRIRYICPNCNTSVGMRDNFEFALNEVKDGYVIALGGDDGLLPGAISKMADILKNTNQKVISWPSPTYIYPGAGIESSQLILYTKLGKLKTGWTILQSNLFLKRQAENLSYASDLESPMFYVKGAVSVDIIDKIKSRSPDNRFYSCPTPDGYSGIVIAGEVDTYAFSYEPLSFFGLSPSSQGLNYLSSDDKALKNSESFFSTVSKVPMHKELASQPYSPLISLMTVDYLLTARDLMGWSDKFPPLDFKKILLKSIDELSHGLYSDNRLERELKILLEISRYHNLENFFLENLEKRKRFEKKNPIEGNALDLNRIFIDCSLFEINNVFEASYFISMLYRVYPKISFSIIVKALVNSIQFKLKSKKKGLKFPDKSLWMN